MLDAIIHRENFSWGISSASVLTLHDQLPVAPDLNYPVI